jgi:hypothetical protein
MANLESRITGLDTFEPRDIYEKANCLYAILCETETRKILPTLKNASPQVIDALFRIANDFFFSDVIFEDLPTGLQIRQKLRLVSLYGEHAIRDDEFQQALKEREALISSKKFIECYLQMSFFKDIPDSASHVGMNLQYFNLNIVAIGRDSVTKGNNERSIFKKYQIVSLIEIMKKLIIYLEE